MASCSVEILSCAGGRVAEFARIRRPPRKPGRAKACPGEECSCKKPGGVDRKRRRATWPLCRGGRPGGRLNKPITCFPRTSSERGSEMVFQAKPTLAVILVFILCDQAWGQNEKPLHQGLHSQVVYGVAFSPNGKFLATGSDDKSVLLWNLATG